eukprot:Skav207522  [mRNA]  locus=scaffold907:247940:262998:+ [translate_table: standard]
MKRSAAQQRCRRSTIKRPGSVKPLKRPASASGVVDRADSGMIHTCVEYVSELTPEVLNREQFLAHLKKYIATAIPKQHVEIAVRRRDSHNEDQFICRFYCKSCADCAAKRFQAKSADAPRSAMIGMVAGESHGEALSWPVAHPCAAGVSEQVNVPEEAVAAPLPASVASLGSVPEMLEDGQVLATLTALFREHLEVILGLQLATEVVPLRSKCRQVRQNEAPVHGSGPTLVDPGACQVHQATLGQVLESSLFHFYIYKGRLCGSSAWDFVSCGDFVGAFRRRGETEEKRRRYDWLPWEVRISADGIGPPLNFEKPVHSFDMFSLGVIALHLTIGRTEADGVSPQDLMWRCSPTEHHVYQQSYEFYSARFRLSAMERAGAGKDLTAVEVIDTSMLGPAPSDSSATLALLALALCRGLDPMLHRLMLGPVLA